MIYVSDPRILDIASFCYAKLGLSRPVDIELKDLEVDGYCYSTGVVEINRNLNTKDMEIAVCHELVHCRQYETTGVADEREAYKLELELYNKYKEK
jgi:hypothetical protein